MLLARIGPVLLAMVALFASALPAAAVDPLVSPQWLRAVLGGPHIVVLDLRGPGEFAAGHIPGAVRSTYPGKWMVERNGVPGELPATADLTALVAGLGIGNADTIVLVAAGSDASGFGVASWPYWVLKYLGADDVAILDGGWTAWRADAANPVEAGPPAPRPAATFTAHLHSEILASTAAVAAALGSTTLIVDARSPDQYEGQATSPLVARAGHIPGAIDFPYATLFQPGTGRLRPVAELRALLPAALANPHREIVLYCNTGHWSSIVWFALHELLGHDRVRLYEGSMAAWSRDPSLPVSTGG